MPQKPQYGNVYLEWFLIMAKTYSKILDYLMDMLMSIPAYPDYITKIDKHKLILISTSLGVEITGDIQDVDNFFKILGQCIKVADDKVERLLKPEDKQLELLKKIIDQEGIEDGDLSEL